MKGPITLMQSTICAVPLLAAAAYFPAQAQRSPGQVEPQPDPAAPRVPGVAAGAAEEYVAGSYGSDTPRCQHRSAKLWLSKGAGGMKAIESHFWRTMAHIRQASDVRDGSMLHVVA